MSQSHPSRCLHCEQPTLADQSFCCQGCKTVYQFLQTHNLQAYYKIKQRDNENSDVKPLEPSGNQYFFLDDEATQKTYGMTSSRLMTFFVEGLHCYACVWLLEKLPEFVKGVQRAEVNFSQQTLSIHLTPDGKFSDAALFLDSIGYRLHLQDNRLRQSVQRASRKAHLIRLGVAAACTANIMIFSVSIYAGLDGLLRLIFEWLSACLMIPVLFYSAAPFFKSAITSLLVKTFNIDVPIATALTLGSSVSAYHLVTGTGSIYFDSLSMFVFLVLVVRYMFQSSYQNLDLQSALSSILIPLEVEKVEGADSRRVPVSTLKASDICLVRSGQTFPVDGTVESVAHVDAQMITGEPYPIKKTPGDDIYAGMKNVGDDVKISVQKTGEHTRLGMLVRHVNLTEKPKTVEAADKIAHWFLVITLLLASGVFLYHLWVNGSFDSGLESALALIVLACPCALSLATPLAYAWSIRAATSLGICIQTGDALEVLSQVKTIFFDKTGTLTYGDLSVVSVQELQKNNQLFNLAYALERQSKHPIGASIRRYILDHHKLTETLHIDDVDEVFGQGVFGKFKGESVKMVGVSHAHEGVYTVVGLFKGDECLAEFTLADSVLEEAPGVVSKLKRQGYEVYLISGDSSSCVEAVKRACDIDVAMGGMSPREKTDIVRKTPHSFMIGDGANDTEALLHADTSLAVHGSFEASLKASDMYSLSKDLTAIPKLLQLAKRTRAVIYTNFAFSLFYNWVGIICVLFGVVHPLFAAVLMPLSSFTVIAYSWLRLNNVDA